MVIFHSYVKLPEGITIYPDWSTFINGSWVFFGHFSIKKNRPSREVTHRPSGAEAMRSTSGPRWMAASAGCWWSPGWKSLQRGVDSFRIVLGIPIFLVFEVFFFGFCFVLRVGQSEHIAHMLDSSIFYGSLKIWVPENYPLVNIQKTMENHHFQWENPL